MSELDFANAVSISGTTVPLVVSAMPTRRLNCATARALPLPASCKPTTRAIIANPLARLGAGARRAVSSNGYQQNETDLVVIVTPHLVAPAAPGQRLASPLDDRLPSNDVDFFLNGQPEVRKRYPDYVTSGADLVGPYGHIIAPGAPPPIAGGAVVKAKD